MLNLEYQVQKSYQEELQSQAAVERIRRAVGEKSGRKMNLIEVLLQVFS